MLVGQAYEKKIFLFVLTSLSLLLSAADTVFGPTAPEKRHTTSVASVTNGLYENPPSLPSRISKKVRLVWMDALGLTPILVAVCSTVFVARFVSSCRRVARFGIFGYPVCCNAAV